MPSLLLILTAAWASPVPSTGGAATPLPVAGEVHSASDTLDAADPDVPFGALEIDCKVPAEILVDGVKLAQLYYPGIARFELRAGVHGLRVYTNGDPTDIPLSIDGDGRSRVLVGRTGITVDSVVSTAEAEATVVPVEFRAVGTMGAELRVGTERYAVPAGGSMQIELPSGSHRLSVRNSDGTVIWASGQLAVTGSERVFVQVAEGRLPEVSGKGSFVGPGG